MLKKDNSDIPIKVVIVPTRKTLSVNINRSGIVTKKITNKIVY